MNVSVLDITWITEKKLFILILWFDYLSQNIDLLT